MRSAVVQSRESAMDVAEHMLRSRGEKGDWIYARRARYLLSSWHSHLSSKAATKKGVLVLYHHCVLPTTSVRRRRSRSPGVEWGLVVDAGHLQHCRQNPPFPSFFHLTTLLTLKPFSFSRNSARWERVVRHDESSPSGEACLRIFARLLPA